MEAVEFRKGWSVAKNKGDVKKTKEGGLSPQEGDVRKKKRRRPRKVVCRNKKGTLSRFKKRKRPRNARRWLREGKVPCVLNREISFLVHEYLGSERLVSLKYRLLRDFVYEEAMCEGSSGNGLPYAAKAVP